MDDLVQLVGPVSQEQNSFGAQVPKLGTTPCWVTVRSVTRSEWQAAGRAGLNPAFVLTTNRANYSGQTEVLYQGKRYSIYRTYSPPESDDIELYLEEKVGVTNSVDPVHAVGGPDAEGDVHDA